MKREDLIQSLAYLLTALVSVGLAFSVSLKFLGASHAQVSFSPPSPTGAPVAPSAQGQTPAASAGDFSDLQGFLEPFLYDSSNRRDPFMPYRDYLPALNTNGTPVGLTLAQRYNLNQLRLVGIMWDIRDPKAMFVDPDQDVIVLGRDESIGNHNGYIASIREGEVVVVESMRHRGNVTYRTRVLRLER